MTAKDCFKAKIGAGRVSKRAGAKMMALIREAEERARAGDTEALRAAHEEAARIAEASGSLAMPAREMPDPIGYICMVSDPDGNNIEFSYDQGVYETAREVWGATAETV